MSFYVASSDDKHQSYQSVFHWSEGQDPLIHTIMNQPHAHETLYKLIYTATKSPSKLQLWKSPKLSKLAHFKTRNSLK